MYQLTTIFLERYNHFIFLRKELKIKLNKGDSFTV